jgi:hypothetical protein
MSGELPVLEEKERRNETDVQQRQLIVLSLIALAFFVMSSTAS